MKPTMPDAPHPGPRITGTETGRPPLSLAVPLFLAKMVSTEALVVHVPGGPFKPETVTLEEPGQGELLVKIVAAAVCHTDLKVNRPTPQPCPGIY
jgi:hypothetical protein